MVAFAAFDDNPMATIPPEFPRDLSDKGGRWAVQSALDLGYRVQTSPLCSIFISVAFESNGKMANKIGKIMSWIAQSTLPHP